MDEIKGYRITRQGLRVYRDELIRREDPRGHTLLLDWREMRPLVCRKKERISARWSHCYVSITPLILDLTAYNFKDEIGNLAS